MKKKRYSIYIGIGLLAVVILMASTHRSVLIPLKGGGSVTMTQPSVFEGLFDSKTTIKFDPNTGEPGNVELLHSFFCSPVIVIPSTNANVFLCVYDDDVDWQLIRIDLSQKFQGVPRESPLHSIVLHSTCKIERVMKSDSDTNDWNMAAATLAKMPANQFRNQSMNLNFGVYRLPYDQKQLVASLRTFRDHGLYPGDPVFIQYKPQQH
jgi:hypothetical protein